MLLMVKLIIKATFYVVQTLELANKNLCLLDYISFYF